MISKNMSEKPPFLVVKKCHANITVYLQLMRIGKDTLLMIHGGDSSHIGAVSIGGQQVEPFHYHYPEHRDDVVSKMALKQLEKYDFGHICVLAGIHVDDITKEEIEIVCRMCEEGIREIIAIYKDQCKE